VSDCQHVSGLSRGQRGVYLPPRLIVHAIERKAFGGDFPEHSRDLHGAARLIVEIALAGHMGE
jgi:hypothetical protein